MYEKDVMSVSFCLILYRCFEDAQKPFRAGICLSVHLAVDKLYFYFFDAMITMIDAEGDMGKETVTLVAAAQLSLENLTFVLNHAYADYYLPIWLDAAQFQQMCEAEDVDLQASAVAMDGDAPVGIALLARRGDRGWVSGVGVRPGWRRQGIARQLLRQVQARARQLGLRVLRLEVLLQNVAGAALYQQLGFSYERDLFVLTQQASHREIVTPPPAIRRAAPAALLARYAAFHTFKAPWQRELASLRHRAPELHGLGYWEQGRLVGYVLYKSLPKHQSIYDVAAAPKHPQRLEIARELLLAAQSFRIRAGGYVINLPAEDPLLPAFKEVSYRVWLHQHELTWQVASGDSETE